MYLIKKSRLNNYPIKGAEAADLLIKGFPNK